MKELEHLILGDKDAYFRSFEEFSSIPVDWNVGNAPILNEIPQQKTIERPFTLSGHGTFEGKNMTTMTFEPTELEGWWFDRVDKVNELPMSSDDPGKYLFEIIPRKYTSTR